jgi:hypothetical protein
MSKKGLYNIDNWLQGQVWYGYNPGLCFVLENVVVASKQKAEVEKTNKGKLDDIMVVSNTRRRLRQLNQGPLTEGEGSVRLTSSLM